ncbi:MAG TPA: FAD-dependent tricarballylate dehydrogenase TcuA [Vicinamibacterales bacterium]|nr:FAD-dependent tricarballylate dehydrogenase TcuA [Vicinamibacterales bacterium]
MSKPREYDVVVVGGGNAALCAALTAREAGATVVVLERAPRDFRGGNSRHTRNLRCAHDAPTAVLTGSYTEDEFYADLLRVNANETDESLARLLICRSKTCTVWMSQYGVRFQAALRGTLHLSRTNAFFLGGGKALMNAYYAAAERMGIDVLYDADVVSIDVRQCSVRLQPDDSRRVRLQPNLRGKTLILASGGFESNLAWLKDAWGDAADNFIVRGTPYNTGVPLRALLDAGAQPIGDPRACHAIAVDARAPKFDGGIVTRLDCIPLGIVVNQSGERFADEGQDLWPKRYASWGTLVARQPGQIAYCLVDAKTANLFMPSVFPPLVANTVAELAVQLGLPAERVGDTVARFNDAVRPGTFDLEGLDDCQTHGLTPEKSHWAQRLDTSPYWGYPLRPGITFTYLGLRVDETMRVMRTDGAPMPNVYAAGEIMSGNVLRRGYIAGIGMTIGTVFGRIAGESAARAAG